MKRNGMPFMEFVQVGVNDQKIALRRVLNLLLLKQPETAKL